MNVEFKKQCQQKQLELIQELVDFLYAQKPDLHFGNDDKQTIVTFIYEQFNLITFQVVSNHNIFNALRAFVFMKVQDKVKITQLNNETTIDKEIQFSFLCMRNIIVKEVLMLLNKDNCEITVNDMQNIFNIKDVKDNKYASTLFNGLSLIQQNDIIEFYVDYIQYLNPYNKLDLLMKIHNNKFISKEHKNKISFDSTLDSIIKVCEYLISISNEMKNDKDNNNNSDNMDNNNTNNNENSIENLQTEIIKNIQPEIPSQTE